LVWWEKGIHVTIIMLVLEELFSVINIQGKDELKKEWIQTGDYVAYKRIFLLGIHNWWFPKSRYLEQCDVTPDKSDNPGNVWYFLSMTDIHANHHVALHLYKAESYGLGKEFEGLVLKMKLWTSYMVDALHDILKDYSSTYTTWMLFMISGWDLMLMAWWKVYPHDSMLHNFLHDMLMSVIKFMISRLHPTEISLDK